VKQIQPSSSYVRGQGREAPQPGLSTNCEEVLK
jgi:hypothetical protein